MNVQEADHLEIPEGYVATIHDSAGKQLWGGLGYSVTFDGDTFQQTYTGKNLFSVSFHSSGTVQPSADNAYTLTKPSARTARFNFPTPLSAGSYVLSFDVVSIESERGMAIDLLPSGGLASVTTTGPATREITVASGATLTGLYMYLSTNDPDGSSVSIKNVQLEAGSTATAYEPYVGGIPAPNPDYPQPISVVKGHQTVTLTGGTVSGEYPLDLIGKNICSNATVRSSYHIDFITDCANITSNKAVLSAITNADLANASVYVFVDGVDLHQSAGTFNGEADKRGYANLTFNSTVMEAIHAGKELKLDLYKSGANFSSVSDAQLEIGETLTDYTPYYNYELCKIGTYQDNIWKDGDDWKIHKVCVSVTFDGSVDEDWALVNTGSANFYYRTYISNYATSPTSDLYCNYFSKATISNSTTNPGCMLINSNQFRSRPSFAELSVTDWRAWLLAHPTTLYYALSTATDTQITDTTLISQLEAIYDFMKRYGYTSAVSGNLPIIINRIPY